MIKISAGKCYVCRIPMVAGEPDHCEVELYGEGYQNVCVGCYETLQEYAQDGIRDDLVFPLLEQERLEEEE